MPAAFRTPSLIAIAAMVLANGPALAQSVAADETARGIEDIVVTAQRRAESLQDVPLAISAVSGEALRAAGIDSAMDMRFVSPSLNFANSVNTRGEGLSVRGVGTNIFGDGVEQSVGVVVDQIPMARNGMGTMALVDIERVEVLRGPQGMLFGKNASAGLISVTTRRPEIGVNSLVVGGSYATLDDIRFNATGNLALGDTGAVRLAYSRVKRDGFVDNINLGGKLNDRDDHIVRGKILAEPIERLSILVIGDWARSRTSCCAFTARSAAPGQAFAALNAAAGITPSPTNLEVAAGAPFFQNQMAWGVSAEANYEFDGATLTGVAGYRYWEAFDNNDPDLLPINVLDRNSGDSRVFQYSTEVRLASTTEGPIDWLVGFFHFNVENRGGNTQAGTLGVPLPPGATLGATRRSETYNNQIALFGQLGWRPVDWLKFSASGRYTDESLSFDWRQFRASGTVGMFPGRPILTVNDARRDTDNFSWRLIAQVEPSDDIMGFASIARGYKGPAYDQQLVSATPVFVDPEIPTSYELGLRAVLFERTTLLNITGFFTEFKNFQAQAFDQNVTPSRFTTVNAGGLETKGIELEFTTRPIEGLTLSANGTWLDSEYTDFQNIACYIGQPILPFGTARTDPRQCIRVSPTGSGVTEGTGLPLTDAPELTYTLSASYEAPVGALMLGGNINWFWRDRVTYASNGDPGLVQDAYGLLGGAVTLRAANDRWRLSVFARNLLDKNFVNRVIAQPVLNSPSGAPQGSYSQFPSPEARRIIGASVEFRFGE
jgi:iron complex outermembrane receptor protein